MQKYTTSTWHNLVPVRDRHMNPYIFVNNIQRRIQNRVDTNLKIQISNGHFFKFLTVKNPNSVNTGEQPSKHVYNIPKPLGHHIWSILSLSLDKIWGGDPCPVVSYLLKYWWFIIFGFHILRGFESCIIIDISVNMISYCF